MPDSTLSVGASQRSFPVVSDGRVHYPDVTVPVAYSVTEEPEPDDADE